MCRSGTIYKKKVQSSVDYWGEQFDIRTWSHVFQRPAVCQFGDSASASTQDARPALSEQENGRERDVEELQIEDEADEFTLSGEQHVQQTSPATLWTAWAEMGGA